MMDQPARPLLLSTLVLVALALLYLPAWARQAAAPAGQQIATTDAHAFSSCSSRS